MALSGKKITELNPISGVTNKTVLPTVYIDDTYTEATATKVTVQQLKTNILTGAVLQPNIVTDTENDAKKAIGFLKESHAGRATFLPLTAIKGKVLDEKDLDDCFGYINLASELVEYDKK